jgi:hypothetical protein
MPPKKLDDLAKFSGDDYEEFCSLLKSVNIDLENDGDLIRTCFNKTKGVLMKLNDELRLTVDLFEKETYESTKKSELYFLK